MTVSGGPEYECKQMREGNGKGLLIDVHRARCLLLRLTLLIRSAIDAGLDDLVLALILILEFVFKFFPVR